MRFRIGGTRLVVHPLVPGALAVAAFLGYGPEAALAAVALLAHEAAHLVVAVAYEAGASELEILPFGGRAVMPDLDLAGPGVEAIVAAAGPLQSLLLAALAASLPESLFDPALAGTFASFNLSLALFNLVPGLPLDGGRMLRALLSPRLGRRRATEVASRAGRAAGIALAAGGALALAQGTFVPGILVLAWLVWQRAGAETWDAALAAVRERLRAAADFRRAGLLPARLLAVHAEVPVARVVRQFAPGRFTLVAVAGDDMRLLGWLCPGDLERAMGEAGPGTPVGRLLPPGGV